MNTNKTETGKGSTAHRLATATALIGTAALAVASFILSFTALTDLVSERSPIPASLAWLWAVSLDGLIVVATVALVALAHTSTRRERAWAAFLLLAGVALSTAGNVAHALIEGFGITGALISALPPVLLASITHLSVSLMRAPAGEVSAQVRETVSAQDERAQDDADRDVSAAYERALAAVNDAMSAHEDERERAVEDERAHAVVSAHEERTPVSDERAADERSDRGGRTPAHLPSPSVSTTANAEVLSFLQEALSEGREPTGSDIGARFGVSAATGRRWKKAAMAQMEGETRELATAA